MLRAGAIVSWLVLFGSPASASQPAPALDLYQRLDEMHHTAWTGKDGLTGKPDSLAQTADGYLWIGTSNGLYRFDGVAFERYQPEAGALPAASVNALLATRDGGLWVGYTRGGASFIAADGRLTNYSVEHGLPVGNIRDFAQDQDGTMWVAATGGLARLESGRWHSVRKDWNYPCLSAWKLLVQRDGTLWVGGASPNKLLFLPKGTRKFHDPGVNLEARALAQIGDTVFVTDGGKTVHRVRRGTDGSAESDVFGDVITSAMARDHDGGLWFAGHGLTRLRVDGPAAELASNPVPSAPERFTIEQGLSARVAYDVLVDREQNV
ncbi:two-component regulator propeller domain-containing protein [Polyangium sp. 15x6]|uniref:ligand-binding sensor domain-containing protein n=1 Tax=Polyangium sp. 15x6 TaxID=3042687 RepID=UPI00249C5AE7|nr:two-component regulator propeller domain-containing protein [Polyangium sp. 15x6]MDI3288019.1 two-component regulator propeller domain-containing protein [Polyangium sp. 15x6]